MCVLELCGFVRARAFCEERNMRVPKSPFEQLSSLAVQFQTKRDQTEEKAGKRRPTFTFRRLRTTDTNCLLGRNEKEILDSFFIWWFRKTVHLFE